jgi:hypothetical protein
MTARPALSRPLQDPRPVWLAAFARLLDRIEVARARARERAELRRRLRADVRLRRDIGLTRFDAIRIDAQD